MTINETIYPPGGYSFTDKDRVTFRAPKLDLLVKSVTAYRQRAGFPMGDPAEEIAVQICKRYPVVCRPGERTSTYAKPNRPPEPPTANRSQILQWMNRLRRAKQEEGTLRMRDDTEARRRVEICKDCPQRTILSGGCAVCGDAVKIIRGAIIGRASISDNLGACMALNCDLAVAIHLDEQALDNPGLPSGCWRKVGS